MAGILLCKQQLYIAADVGKLELELCSHVADNVDQDNEDLQKREEQPTDDRNVNLFSYFNQII